MLFSLAPDGSYIPTRTPATYVEKLPAGVYSVEFSDLRRFYLMPTASFVLPPKTYGKTNDHATRILKAAETEPRCLGVILAGEKGSGKTLLAKEVAIRSGLPTILISRPFVSSEFFLFLQEIEQPAVLLFDEFEKVFGDDDQDAILTLFDGAFPMSRKIAILTVNSLAKVREHLRNRPGRMRYMIEFEGLESDFIKEYCADQLQDKTYLPNILRLALTCYTFNFDMLQAVVRELNAFGGKFDDMVDILNAKPPSKRMSSGMSWKYKITKTEAPNEVWENPDIYGKVHGPWYCTEAGRSWTLTRASTSKPKRGQKPPPPETAYVWLSAESISGIDARTGEVFLRVYDDDDQEYQITATPYYAEAAAFDVRGLD